MFKKMIIAIAGIAACAGLAGCGSKQEIFNETPVEEIKVGALDVMASVHDPSVIKGEGGAYYIFGTHMSSAKSTDLVHWKSFSDGVSKKNPLFGNLFDEELAAFQFVGKNNENWYSVWAPDVVYNKAMEKYVMYFCTSSTYVLSNICMATSDNIEGPYEYQDTLLYSGFIKSTILKTNFLDYVDKSKIKDYTQSGLGYNNQYWPNCIDPTVFYDADGKMWMVYGSWSGGIFLLEIEESTGYPIHPAEDEENQVDAYFGKRLLGGYHQSIEGPYILYDEQTKYYYLFVSYGSLTREGGYQVRLFRSQKVDGPYVDAEGRTMTMVDAQNPEYNKEYGLKMMGNYDFPSLKQAYMAPGHNSAFIDDDGKMYIVYHQRFDDGSEFHQPRVHQLFTNKEGWLVAAPFETSGETLKQEGYTGKEIAGTYYVVNHGTDISKTIHEPEELKFYSDGTVRRIENGEPAEAGSYTLEKGTPYAAIQLGEDSYEGIFIEMTDEAGNEVLCFTAAGTNNETVWGVHYK